MTIVVLPVLFEGEVKAVVELASFQQLSEIHVAFLDQLTESIGIVLNTIEANMRTEDLLKQSQSLARELQSQQEELQQTNAELEEKAKLLAEQNVEVERKNTEVEQARQALEEKAKQLALTSKYKSEFLANMSHELRTPLNSLLILSDQLSKNGEGNLSARQIEFSKTIHSSGNDLLTLINDILDLSKIESGTVIVDVGEVGFRDLHDYVDRTFRHIAEGKNLEFNVEIAPQVARSMQTDAKRLQQILKNLLSNAFKFTDRGQVSLDVRPAANGWSADNESLNRAKSVIAFCVTDTGIGIPPEKQQIIFEAFQQADGSTSRKYGGTGLGLAISREIARLLGGEIRLASTMGEGSTFTLYLPQAYAVRPARRQAQTNAETANGPVLVLPSGVAGRSAQDSAAPDSNGFADDSANLQKGDRVLLIVENDPHFSRFLLDVARENGFKGVVMGRGSAALQAVPKLKPAAITLDINLPDIDGWRVLDRLKDDAATRHIPVQIITTEEERERGLRMGAMGALIMPLKTREALDQTFSRIKQFVEPQTRRILIVESDAERRALVSDLLAGDDVSLVTAPTAAEALASAREAGPDLIVLSLQLADKSGFELIDELREEAGLRDTPIVVIAAGDLSKKEELHLKRLAQTMVLKDVRSPERLLDEVSLFLHRPLATMADDRRGMLEELHQSSTILANKKALIVDDDIRNIFAMTSLLEPHRMHVMSAETGRGAIEALQNNPDIDVVLMDIMMPDMDGYDTMRAIRKLSKFRALPIIALTAKAMKGDREKCIEAGASDYISKPVDTEQLLALLRVWLYR
jgi:signal transduction histidine kinase/DNA-binding response OmpR family regulator